mgnify:CR=1 FL=1
MHKSEGSHLAGRVRDVGSDRADAVVAAADDFRADRTCAFLSTLRLISCPQEGARRQRQGGTDDVLAIYVHVAEMDNLERLAALADPLALLHLLLHRRLALERVGPSRALLRGLGRRVERDGVGDDLLKRAQAKDGAAEVFSRVAREADAPEVVCEDRGLGSDCSCADVRVLDLRRLSACAISTVQQMDARQG